MPQAQQKKTVAIVGLGYVGLPLAVLAEEKGWLTLGYDTDAHRIYLHTAQEGRTHRNIAANPQVCFGIADMGRLLPADTAMEFSVEYESVIVFGRGRVVTEEAEGRYALQGLLDKYFPDLRPGEDYRHITHHEWKQTAVLAIEVQSWSGKRKRQDP